MPNMDELISSLAGHKFFTKLDMMMGYHQIELEENSKRLTAFVTHNAHYEFNRVPFGLVNAPSVFQDIMNKIAKHFKPGEVIVFFDDIVIPGGTATQALNHLQNFLEILRKYDLKLRLNKCKFLATEISFLGHKIHANGISPGDEKKEMLLNISKNQPM